MVITVLPELETAHSDKKRFFCYSDTEILDGR